MTEHPGWAAQASRNIEEWGTQDLSTLLLAAMEELGELTQAYLEALHEDGDRDRIQEEVNDLGALLVQIHWRLNNYDPRDDADLEAGP